MKPQDANPSLSFSWDTKSKPTKVFARKRKIKNTTNTSESTKPSLNDTPKQPEATRAVDINKSLTKQQRKDNKQVSSDIQTNNESNNNEKDYNDAPKGHIKRKQKKDKLLAKQLAREGKSDQQKVNNNDTKNYSLFNNIHKELYVDTRAGKSVSEKVFVGGSFKDLDIHHHVVSNLEKLNYKDLTNVQGKAIPVIMSGKNTLVRSQTGSGKTLAYAVPIIDALQGINPRLKRTDGVQAIIVVPTRELVQQTHELFMKLNTFQWVVVGHLCGGENRKSEKDRIRKGINILIGTPGRLLDHILHTSALKVDSVRCLVLDEADRLLDMGFRKDIISLVEAIDKSKTNSTYDPLALLKKNKSEETTESADSDSDIPILKNRNSKARQTILLSATLNKGVSELAEFTMKEHTFIDGLDQVSNAITDSFVIPDTVKQEFMMTYVKHRLFTLSALLVEKSKMPNSKIFVFMASMQMVEFHYELFTKCLIKMPRNRGKLKVGNVVVMEESDSDDEEDMVLDIGFFKLHGNMDQKERKEVFTSFRAATKGVLLCTDVAARGLDVPTADCIIQYNGPQNDEDYLHRVGRTGRAGKSGSAVIFLTHEEQEYITHLREHRVFLKQANPEKSLQHLCELMKEPDHESAATALQRHYETCVSKDKALHKAACFAYSTWSRFYNSYPSKMRQFFNSKKVNLGHYVTTFALRETPTTVAQVVRGQVSKVESPRLNKKLANHKDNAELTRPRQEKRKNPRSISLSTSEFSSGLEPSKKKKKFKK